MGVPSSNNDKWFTRFALRLRELSPPTSEPDALEIAQVAFDRANDMEPEDAAAVFGEILVAHVSVHDLRAWLKTRASPR